MSHLRELRPDLVRHEHECRSIISRWRLNWESGSRASQLLDYRYLTDVVDELVTHHENHRAWSLAVQEIIRELVSRVGDDARYRIDGRTLKSPDDASERAALSDTLRSRLGELAPRSAR